MADIMNEDETQNVPAVDEGYSFELPGNFFEDVRSSVEEAAAQVTQSIPKVQDILAQAQLLPGVKVDRQQYLREVLKSRGDNLVEAAIARTPQEAGLSRRDIARLARKQQGREARRTTVISFAAGFAGGLAAAATIPADLVQFYGHLMRMIQMLTYLFGWRDLCRIEASGMGEATKSAYMLFLGVASGDETADDLLRRLAPLRAMDGACEAALVEGATGLIEAHLTDRLARRVSGQVVGKSVPIAGAIISSTISYGGFSDMCGRLRKQLEEVY